MSRQQYTDPYNTDGRYYYQNDSVDFNDSTRGPFAQQDYNNNGATTYDPYSSSNLNQAQYPSDDMAGRDDGHRRNISHSSGTKNVTYAQDDTMGTHDVTRNASAIRRTGPSTRSKQPVSQISIEPVRKQWNGFDHGEFTPVTTRPSKGMKGLKDYRKDANGNLWTKGGRARSCGRVVCCTLMLTVLIILSVVLSLALWARPPSIVIGDVLTKNTTGSLASPDGLEINLEVPITVDNPNYFSVEFKKLKVEIFYPINRTPVGGGEIRDLIIESGEETDFNFPFKLSYKSSDDPGSVVFVDLGEKCGVGGGRKQNIVVIYRLTLGLRLLSLITISPVIENRFSFVCPDAIAAGATTVLTGGNGRN